MGRYIHEKGGEKGKKKEIKRENSNRQGRGGGDGKRDMRGGGTKSEAGEEKEKLEEGEGGWVGGWL